MLAKPEEENLGDLYLSPLERETNISWCDEDKDRVFVYTSQQPMIRRLLRNPLFECSDKKFNQSYACYPDPISVEGFLPLKALTLRTRIRKMTDEQRKQAAERLEHARESRKP